MKIIYIREWYSFTITKSALFVVMCGFIIWSFGFNRLLFMLLSIIVMSLCIKAVNRSSETKKRLNRKKYLAVENCAEQRLLLLRRLIDLSLTYEGNTELFHRKFREAINIRQIRNGCIMDVVLFNLDEKMLQQLSKEDIEFYLLCIEGFTYRELSVIYNHSNPQSIYVRQSRVRRRIKAHST